VAGAVGVKMVSAEEKREEKETEKEKETNGGRARS
jgi:hypothetical protein